MKQFIVKILCLSCLIANLNAQDSTQIKKAFIDTLNRTEMQEESFQGFLDTLFRDNVDTTGWNNRMINIGSFDPEKMSDSIRFIFIDSSKYVHFVPPFKNYVTCGFGPRRWIFHFGMDIKLLKGDSVRAAFDGIVRVTKYDRRGYGNVVVIRHKQGIESIYGHLSKVLVTTNQHVKAGELIGFGGNSGRSTGSHLHFETRFRGEPFDPSCFYDFSNYQLKHDTIVISRANFEYLIELKKIKWHTIKKGDTLGKIAHEHYTTVAKLCKLNGCTTKTLLRIGRKIRYQ